VPALIAKREIVSASTMAALLYLLAVPSAQEAGAPPFPVGSTAHADVSELARAC
jgi:hypothetical protein